MGDTVVVGVAGRMASGKTSVATHLVNRYGLQRLSYSSLLSKRLASNGLAVNRENLQLLGGSLIATMGAAGLTAELLSYAGRKDRLVIDGLRHLDAVTYLREAFRDSLLLIFRDVDAHDRWRMLRSREASDISWERFLELDDAPVEREAAAVMEQADLVLARYERVESLYEAVDLFMRQRTCAS